MTFKRAADPAKRHAQRAIINRYYHQKRRSMDYARTVQIIFPAGCNTAQFGFRAPWSAVENMAIDGATDEISGRINLSLTSCISMANALIRFATDEFLLAEARRRKLLPPSAPPGWEITERPDSSWIRRIGYNAVKCELVLDSTTGVYRYVEVGLEIWHGIRRAESVGKFYNEFVKGKFPSMKVDAFPGDR